MIHMLQSNRYSVQSYVDVDYQQAGHVCGSWLSARLSPVVNNYLFSEPLPVGVDFVCCGLLFFLLSLQLCDKIRCNCVIKLWKKSVRVHAAVTHRDVAQPVCIFSGKCFTFIGRRNWLR